MENIQGLVMLIVFTVLSVSCNSLAQPRWLSMVNQAHIKHEGLEAGLVSELGLVPACHGRPSVFRGGVGVWACGVFPLPCDSHGGAEGGSGGRVLCCPVLSLREGLEVNEQRRGWTETWCSAFHGAFSCHHTPILTHTDWTPVNWHPVMPQQCIKYTQKPREKKLCL